MKLIAKELRGLNRNNRGTAKSAPSAYILKNRLYEKLVEHIKFIKGGTRKVSCNDEKENKCGNFGSRQGHKNEVRNAESSAQDF